MTAPLPHDQSDQTRVFHRKQFRWRCDQPQRNAGGMTARYHFVLGRAGVSMLLDAIDNRKPSGAL